MKSVEIYLCLVDQKRWIILVLKLEHYGRDDLDMLEDIKYGRCLAPSFDLIDLDF